MKIIIHRGTHQIGGVATEIRTDNTRILIDLGDELSNDPNFVQKPLDIPGITSRDWYNGILFTHNHGDHIGQLRNLKCGNPIYMGAMMRDVLLATNAHAGNHSIDVKLKGANIFEQDKPFYIGDIRITPFCIDHSACDSYMFLIEVDGKRILHTGDFRTHGFRGKAVPKILDKKVGKVDVLITEGTTLSRPASQPMSERELQQKVREYINKYKYVYVLCSSTNLDRICGVAHVVPRGKYFICDSYEKELLEIIENHWGHFSSLYKVPKCTVYGGNLLSSFAERGFVMIVRANNRFVNIIQQFDPSQSIILYSMWDGYRTRLNSNIPDFLKLTDTWQTLHTSGHAAPDDIKMLIDKTKPKMILPMHTEVPEALKLICPNENIVLLKDGEELSIS